MTIEPAFTLFVSSYDYLRDGCQPCHADRGLVSFVTAAPHLKSFVSSSHVAHGKVASQSCLA